MYQIKSQSDYDNRTQSHDLIILRNIRVSPDDTESLRQLHTWDVSKCRAFNLMFHNCKINSDITGWDMSSCRISAYMFDNCHEFNQDISGWNMENCIDSSYMFNNCYMFNQDIGNWDMKNCGCMTGMFQYCISFDQDLSGWELPKCLHHNHVFALCPSMTEQNRCNFTCHASTYHDPTESIDMDDALEKMKKLSEHYNF